MNTNEGKMCGGRAGSVYQYISFTGCMEMILGLDSYLETAVARSTVTLLKLRRQQFERIFKRRYAAGTLDTFRDYLAQRLCLYIYQCPQPSSAFLKFINIRLADADVLKNLRKAMYEMRDGVFGGAAGGGASVQEQKERSEKMVELKKRLHIPSGWEISLPAEDLADIALANLSKRLKVWSLLSQVNGGRPVRIQNHVHVVCWHTCRERKRQDVWRLAGLRTIKAVKIVVETNESTVLLTKHDTTK